MICKDCLLYVGKVTFSCYTNFLCGYMHIAHCTLHIIRFLPQENESQCASPACTPDRHERQTTKLSENIKCSESVNPKHQSSICRKSSSVPRASNVNVGTFDAQAFYLRPFKIQKLQGERTGKKAEQSISKKTLRHCSHNSPSPRLPDEI